MAKPATLYDSDSSSSSVDAANSFTVNKDYQAKFQAKKQREELSKLQDKYGKDYSLSDDDDSEESLSDDDSDAELVTPQVDVAILRTLAKIRSKDPSVYDAQRQVYDEEEQGLGSTSTTKKQSSKATKPVLLKDYQRARILEDPSLSRPDSAPDASFRPTTHVQEERALKEEVKRAFFAGGEDDNDDNESGDDDADGFLIKRSKTKGEQDREEEEYAAFLRKNAGKQAVDAALETEEAFLRDYILNRGWIEKDDKLRIPSYKEITGGDSTDDDATAPQKKRKSSSTSKSRAARDENGEELLDEYGQPIPDPGLHDDEDSEFEDQAEEFETKYNFRFEEAQGNNIVSHARNAVSTVRKPTAAVSARQRAREAAKERKEQEKQERKEEVRRLKALKRKEVEAKLSQLIEAAGEGTQGLEDLDLEGDWDPEEHDRKMAAIYGGDYGQADDADFKPTWDDDIDITDLVGPEGEDGDADLHMSFASADGEDGEGEGGEGAHAVETKREKKDKKRDKKRKRDEEGFPTELLEAASRGGDEERKQLLDRMVDDYYAIDYEDKVGDLPTRFKYTKVTPSSFNLTPSEILLATDAELNAYMSLRKLAPYRQGEESNKKLKKKLKELRDKLKGREWGQELDEADEWRVDDARGGKRQKRGDTATADGHRRRRNEGEGGGNGDGKPKKRAGKSERKRKASAAVAGESTAAN